MAIVTISRGSYQKGKVVAEKVASRLGYECISREILIEASDEFNIPEIKLIRALHDAPTVLERFRYGKERYVSHLRSALLQHAKNDNIVYHGLAGHYFLQEIPHVLKVRIIADMKDRVADEVNRENISAEKARYILTKDDEERRKWGIQVYGTDTWDSRLYDLVLKIKSLTVDDAVDLILDAVARPAFQSTPQSLKIIGDLALATRVQATVCSLTPRIGVCANDGTIYIRNTGDAPTFSKEIAQEIKKLAQGVEGVGKVVLDAPSDFEQSDHVNPFHNIG